MQLDPDRKACELSGHSTCDVVIVGAGISGVATAYHLLRSTSKTVTLVDGDRIAHGATGRNAGQVVNGFERPFMDIVETFGEEMAVQAYIAVESAWDMLQDILEECAIQAPFIRCKAYDGFCVMDDLIAYLRQLMILERHGYTVEPVLMTPDPELLKQIPSDALHLVQEMPHATILHLLETVDEKFFALSVSKVGCTNSAKLCEELVVWMLRNYSDRFRVGEHVFIEHIELGDEGAILTGEDISLHASHVVLCTNGFENFHINNTVGENIDTAFHQEVHGVIGYMAGCTTKESLIPAALSYLSEDRDTLTPYYYVTRRPFAEHVGAPSFTLTCIGGPERFLPDAATYEPYEAFPADIEEQLLKSLHDVYHDASGIPDHQYRWQGLMCYTPNMLRRIGFEPKNRVLLYNLGCNGIGILTAVYGGKRIAQLLSHMPVEPSIFDPA